MKQSPENRSFPSRAEIIDKLNFKRRFLRWVGAAAAALLALCLLVFLKGNSMLLFLLTLFGSYLLLSVGFSLIWHRKFGSWNLQLDEEELRSQIFCAALQEKFQEVRFSPEEGLPEETVKASRFPFAERYGRYEGKNHASAVCGTARVELCSAAVGDLRKVTDAPDDLHPRGEQYEVLDESFRGLFAVCRLGGSFSPVTVVSGNRGSRKDSLSTGDPDFDRAFTVTADDPERAGLTLTEKMRRFLTRAAETAGCRICVSFAEDGTVYAALDQEAFDRKNRRGEEVFERMDRRLGFIEELVKSISARELP